MYPLARLFRPGVRVAAVTAAVVAFNLPQAQAQAEGTEGGRAAAHRLLRESHPYDPAIREQAMQMLAESQDAVRLPQVMVVESRLHRLLTQSLATQQRAIDARRRSLANGAALDRMFLGLPTRIGVLPYENLLPAGLREGPDGSPAARFTLVSAFW